MNHLKWQIKGIGYDILVFAEVLHVFGPSNLCFVDLNQKFYCNDYYFSRKMASLRWYHHNSNSTDLVTISWAFRKKGAITFGQHYPCVCQRNMFCGHFSFILPTMFSVSMFIKCYWYASRPSCKPVSGVSEILGDIFKQVNFACHVEFTVCPLCLVSFSILHITQYYG